MRVAVLSDIHGNLAALQAVLADAGEVDETWCLGDVVGYGPEPNECIALLREREPRLLCVAGNHDWAALDKVDISAFNADARRAAVWTRAALTPENTAYLASLPQRCERGDFTLVHGTPREPVWEYMASLSVAQANFSAFSTRYCLLGHTHIPVVVAQGEQGNSTPELLAVQAEEAFVLTERRLFINPGSVGQPRDGVPDASYLLLDTDAPALEYRRVPYDIAATQRLMAEAGLPPRLIARLIYGL